MKSSTLRILGIVSAALVFMSLALPWWEIWYFYPSTPSPHIRRFFLWGYTNGYVRGYEGSDASIAYIGLVLMVISGVMEAIASSVAKVTKKRKTLFGLSCLLVMLSVAISMAGLDYVVASEMRSYSRNYPSFGLLPALLSVIILLVLSIKYPKAEEATAIASSTPNAERAKHGPHNHKPIKHFLASTLDKQDSV